VGSIKGAQSPDGEIVLVIAMPKALDTTRTGAKNNRPHPFTRLPLNLSWRNKEPFLGREDSS
jgi:hypothetical protein